MRSSRIRRLTHLAVAAAVGLVTIVQILRPAVNQDVRYVLGALATTGAAGQSWIEVWAHRPLVARGTIALFDALSPGEFLVEETLLRAWSVALAAGAAVVLWRGLVRRVDRAAAGWSALAVGAALAWAPGWDFAEPEWYAAALAVAAIGLAVGWRRGPIGAGVLLGLVVAMKYTTVTTALAALLIVLALDRSRGLATALVTAASTVIVLAGAVLVSPHEWQWLRDMPLLNPGFRFTAVPQVIEGMVNSLVVSPITIVALVAIVGLLLRGGQGARLGLLAVAILALLVAPFMIQQQNFLYHLSALPVAAAGLVAALAARSPVLPIGLPLAGLLGLVGGVGLFALGPRTRDQNWWIADIVIAVALAAGLIALLIQLRRGMPAAQGAERPARRSRGLTLIALACLAPLVVTLSPRTAYSFSLAHNRVTAGDNHAQAEAGPDRRARAHAALPGNTPVVYLSFSAPYWLGYPTPCRYASPTFLQRAVGARAEAVAQSPSFSENLACLDDQAARAVVVEPGWFDVDRVRPEVRSALERNFDCADPAYADDGWLICRRR
ncbi:hypothetical protein AADG42_15140 [Ammonicoccus fulvus]|uniref:Glycosyltransferase RgtA/B/C/D-like domain-containing protein n=1 Tax=Ammonicoccus fulvus TaxID=3138240 RepID=A0ABZ3FUY0_9ACTN